MTHPKIDQSPCPHCLEHRRSAELATQAADAALQTLADVYYILTGMRCTIVEASARVVPAARARMAAMTATQVEHGLREQLQRERINLRKALDRIATLEGTRGVP